MSIRVLSESTPTARKEHDCMACDFVFSHGIDGYGYSFAEKRALVKARKNAYKIKKGQKYIKQNNICDGEFYTFKAIPEIDEICVVHGLYVD